MRATTDNLTTSIRIIAAVALLAGVVWSARNLLVLPGDKRKLQARIETLEQLLDLRAEQQREHRRLAALNNLPRPVRPVPPAGLFAGMELKTEPETAERGVRALSDGWRLRRVEMRLPEIEAAALEEMISAASDLRPPWVLRECDIKALPDQAGRVRVVLQMETLERD